MSPVGKHTCPDEEQLERYFAGACAAPAASSLDAHVAACVRCRSWLDEAREDEALLGRIRPIVDESNGESSAGGLGGVGTAGPGRIDGELGGVSGFRILRQIGAGGMGRVFEAEQLEPRRRVAIKVLRDGALADPARIRFFQREIEALARLKHAGIAAIYASGVTADQSPFFAMELIEGATLTAYARQKNLGLAGRLDLFRRICDAVTFAHQKGVIHRDLKPANILVVEDEGEETRNVQSGVRDEKATDLALDSRTPPLKRWATPLLKRWATPPDREGQVGEQGPLPYGRGSDRPSNPQPKVLDFGLARIADENPLTMEADVGRIRGTLPYMSPEQARGAVDQIDTRTDVYSLGVILYELLCERLPFDLSRLGIPEAVRVICEEAPRRPSELKAGHRGPFRSDLDTIILKALEKDPARRYDSVAALREDIELHLTRRPIHARRPSAWYLGRKFAARHTIAVSLAAVIVLLIVGFGISASAQSARLARERDKALKVSKYLEGMLEWFDPSQTQSGEVTLRQVLDQAAERVDGELAEQPEVAAPLHATLGNGYLSIGAYELGQRHLRLALATQRELFGTQNATVAETMNDLAKTLKYQGDFAASEAMFLEALEMRRRILGEENIAVAETLNDLGALRADQMRYAEAGELIERAVAIHRLHAGADELDLASGLSNLGFIRFATGRAAEAALLLREALEIRRRLNGGNDPQTAKLLTNWGSLMLHTTGDIAEAEVRMREALAIWRSSVGDDHPDTASAWDNLRLVLKAKGDLAGAEECLRQAERIRERIVASSQPGGS